MQEARLAGGGSGTECAGTYLLRNTSNLDIKPDTALQDFAPGSFDVITLWHVMEHLEHLNETWDTLNKLLTEKECPDYCSA